MPFVCRFLLFFGVLLGFTLVSSDVWGQVSDSPLAIGASEAPAAPLQRTPLNAVVLVDETSGETILTLPGDWTLEELDNIYTLLPSKQQDAVPPFTIQQMTAQGNVVGNRVEAVLRFRIATQSGQTIRIPLGLKEGILPFLSSYEVSDGKESPLPYQYTGPGVFDLIVNPQDGQYIALIRSQDRARKDLLAKTDPSPFFGDTSERLVVSDAGEEIEAKKPEPTKRPPKEAVTEQRHELTLQLWFPLTGLGVDDHRLTISFPRAVSSQLRLSVPMSDATAMVSQGSLLDTSFPDEGKTTLFTVRGLGSNFEISWHKGKLDQVEERPVLHVKDAAVVARLDNQSTLYDAVLPISSSVGFDRVFVRLPQDAALDQGGPESSISASEYTLRELSQEERSAIQSPGGGIVPASDGAVYEVRFVRKMASQTVRLRAVQSVPADKAGAFRDIGGFEVLGAERQTGTLSVGIPDEMRPNWRPMGGLRRVDSPTGPGQEGIDTRFEFFAQPFLLRAQIVLPQTRINVKPEYQIQVNKGQLRLNARFSYVVHGSHTDKLQFTFPDWRWIDIAPGNIVDLKSVGEVDSANLLTVPLRAPFDGAFEVELTAFQPISLDEATKHRLTVRLPSPIADWIEPASVVIIPADNVELVPVDDERSSVGLARKSRRTLPVQIEIPSRQQEPLVYQTESASPVFVTDLLYHRQSVAVSVRNTVQLLEPENQVTANLVYTVAHEPIDRVVWLVPKSLDVTGRWSAFYGEKPLEVRDIPMDSNEESTERWAKKRITLPEAMIGRIPLTVRYSIPPVVFGPGITGVQSPISLIRPVEAEVSNVEVNLSVRGGFRIELYGDDAASWVPMDPPPLVGIASQRQSRLVGFSSPKSQERIPLQISVEEREPHGTTIVEKAWLQTWLTDRIRMDRGVYQLTSDRESIALKLPASVGKGIGVQLDGVPISVRPSSTGDLRIPLTPEQQFRSLVLEVWYQLPGDSSHGLVRMELPQFDPSTVIRCAYWQLILPQYRHIVGFPTDWSPEYDWRWNGLFWGRTPSLRMETIGFSDNPTNAPPTNASQYLFSSLHSPANVSFYVLNRSWIVLISSGLALFVGLALIYFPRCRYAGSLLGLAIALAATVFYRPAPVLLALQAASLGVLIALGACYVYRILNRGDRWNIVPKRSLWRSLDDESQLSPVYPVIIDESDSKKESSGTKS